MSIFSAGQAILITDFSLMFNTITMPAFSLITECQHLACTTPRHIISIEFRELGSVVATYSLNLEKKRITTTEAFKEAHQCFSQSHSKDSVLWKLLQNIVKGWVSRSHNKPTSAFSFP